MSMLKTVAVTRLYFVQICRCFALVSRNVARVSHNHSGPKVTCLNWIELGAKWSRKTVQKSNRLDYEMNAHVLHRPDIIK